MSMNEEYKRQYWVNRKFSEISKENCDALPPDAIPLADLYPNADFKPLHDFWYSYECDKLYIRFNDHLYRLVIPENQITVGRYRKDVVYLPAPHRYVLATRGYVPMSVIPKVRYLKVYPDDDGEYRTWLKLVEIN